jgi:hypothetical protein
VFAFAALAFTLFGIKLWVIATAANATPFWDQWGAEGEQLFLALMRGQLHLGTLVAAHNEHRILTTRLVAIALWKLNGLWNPVLEMLVGAMIHVAAILLTLGLIWRSLGRTNLKPLLGFSLVLFGLPFGWFNVVLGFQIQFYWLILFSVAALGLLSTAEAFGRRYWAGIAVAVLAYFSMGSGILCVAAPAAVGTIHWMLRLRRGARHVFGIVVLVALAAIGYAFVPKLPPGSIWVVRSFAQFMNGMLELLSWPFPPGAIAAFVRNAPVLAFWIAMIRRRVPSADARWFLVAIGAWVLGQSAAISYGRGGFGSVLNAKYLDIVTIGVLTDLSSLLALVAMRRDARASRVLRPAGALWLLAICSGIAFAAVIGGEHDVSGSLQDQLRTWHEISSAYELNTRNYLRTRDIRNLQDKPIMRVPYSPPEALAAWLDMTEVQGMLPSNLRFGLVPSAIEISGGFVPQGYFQSTPPRFDPLFGSYSQMGDKATGGATARFNAPRAMTVAIPVAGYPRAENMELTIEQNGRLRPLRPPVDPHESWMLMYVHVDQGSFSIHAHDLNQGTWMAIGEPVVVGRLDPLADRLLAEGSLASYPAWLGIGLCLAILAALGDANDSAGMPPLASRASAAERVSV